MFRKHSKSKYNFIKNLFSKIPHKEWRHLCKAVLCLICIFAVLICIGSVSKMAIYVNSRKIGYVDNEKQAITLVDEYNNFASEHHSMSNIVLKNELSFSPEAMTNGEIKNEINATKNQEFSYAFGLYLDGTLVAVANNALSLHNAISQIEELASKALGCDATIYNNIEIQKNFYTTESILAEANICSYILDNKDINKESLTHATVLNENKNAIRLYSLNGILFETFSYRKVEHTIKAETIIVEDPTIHQGTKIVEEEGQDGKTVDTYRQTIFENKILDEELIDTQIITEVKDRKVIIGTKKIVSSATSNALVFPLNTKNFVYTSEFGGRTDPITGEYSFHSGIDIACSIGTSVVSAGDGEVVASTDNGGNAGITITVLHTNGLTTQYMHLSKRMVKVGDKVYAGQEIALSGNSGRSTGPHLHFSVYDKNGNLVNPRSYTNMP